MSSLQKSVLKSKLPPCPPSRSNKRQALRKKDFTPLSWDKYFENSQDVKTDRGTFRVYSIGNEGPALVLLHGGGLSALGWATFSVSVSKLVNCQVVALDLRGHGSTETKDESDLSSETLSRDVGCVLEALWPDNPPLVVLMGHSMGGAVAVHAAVNGHVPTLSGLVVIDVVEGTAMEALSSMQSFLRSRPKTFQTLETAIEWSVKSGQVRNLESARVSMPGQIKNVDTGQLAIDDIANYVPAADSGSSLPDPDIIPEDAETLPQDFKAPDSPKAKYKWRIDLTQSEKYWSGWFAGMSKLFLSVAEPKLLILAGIDTLDKELMVGQMQGKFQMQVLPKCGHAVHEDVPDQVAELLASFLVRYRLADAKQGFNRPFPEC